MAVEKILFLGIILVVMSVYGAIFRFPDNNPLYGSNSAILACYVLVRPHCHGVVEVNRLWPPLSRDYVAMQKVNVDATRSLRDKPRSCVIVCLLHYAQVIHLLSPIFFTLTFLLHLPLYDPCR